MRLVPAVIVLLLALVACGDDTTTVASEATVRADERYRAAAATVLDAEDGPQLCLGGVAESLPPQCDGPDIVGWDWADVDDEETAGGTTWGEYSVVGTWDGERLTVTERPGPPLDPPDRDSPDLATPCEAPAGGWVVVDAATTTETAQQAAMDYARNQPDFGGLWVDQSINPASGSEEPDEIESEMNDPALLVLNVRFTGDLERHESEVRQRWGGPLCVSEADRPLSDLLSIQAELRDEPGFLGSSADEVQGVVELAVVVDDSIQAELDDRYGAGVVEVSAALRPVG